MSANKVRIFDSRILGVQFDKHFLNTSYFSFCTCVCVENDITTKLSTSVSMIKTTG